MKRILTLGGKVANFETGLSVFRMALETKFKAGLPIGPPEKRALN
jgi:hypothetical protein